MENTTLHATATDAFNQAERGFAVELDPDVAEGLGAFAEDALTLRDVLNDVHVEGSDEH